jgi:hypothetical protein
MFPAYARPNYYSRPRYVTMLLLPTPFVAFAAYVAWIVVPLVVTAVVPAVVQSVTAN